MKRDGQAIDHDKLQREQSAQRILAATHKIFGGIPIDPKYEQLMALFIEGEKEMYLTMKLYDALAFAAEGNTYAIGVMLEESQIRHGELLREWNNFREEQMNHGNDK
jgi:hypothetical protein